MCTPGINVWKQGIPDNNQNSASCNLFGHIPDRNPFGVIYPAYPAWYLQSDSSNTSQEEKSAKRQKTCRTRRNVKGQWVNHPTNPGVRIWREESDEKCPKPLSPSIEGRQASLTQPTSSSSTVNGLLSAPRQAQLSRMSTEAIPSSTQISQAVVTNPTSSTNGQPCMDTTQS